MPSKKKPSQLTLQQTRLIVRDYKRNSAAPIYDEHRSSYAERGRYGWKRRGDSSASAPWRPISGAYEWLSPKISQAAEIVAAPVRKGVRLASAPVRALKYIPGVGYVVTGLGRAGKWVLQNPGKTAAAVVLGAGLLGFGRGWEDENVSLAHDTLGKTATGEYLQDLGKGIQQLGESNLVNKWAPKLAEAAKSVGDTVEVAGSVANRTVRKALLGYAAGKKAAQHMGYLSRHGYNVAKGMGNVGMSFFHRDLRGVGSGLYQTGKGTLGMLKQGTLAAHSGGRAIANYARLGSDYVLGNAWSEIAKGRAEELARNPKSYAATRATKKAAKKPPQMTNEEAYMRALEMQIY